MSAVEKGRENPEPIYESVGRALSSWEWIEAHMAVLFSLLIGADRAAYAAVRAYGTVTNVRGKSSMVKEAASVFYYAHQDEQSHERLRLVLKDYEKKSDSRNEIAHGIVNPHPLGGWALFPSYMASRKRTIVDPDAHSTEPKYIYCSSEIDDISQAFNDLYYPIMVCVGDVMRLDPRD